MRGAVPDHRAGAVPPVPAQRPWPVAVKAHLHPQTAPPADGTGATAPPAGRGTEPQRPAPAEGPLRRRQCRQPAAGADPARRPGRRGAGRRQRLCSGTGRAG